MGWFLKMPASSWIRHLECCKHKLWFVTSNSENFGIIQFLTTVGFFFPITPAYKGHPLATFWAKKSPDRLYIIRNYSSASVRHTAAGYLLKAFVIYRFWYLKHQDPSTQILVMQVIRLTWNVFNNSRTMCGGTKRNKDEHVNRGKT